MGTLLSVKPLAPIVMAGRKLSLAAFLEELRAKI
jgi:hypothetical protein